MPDSALILQGTNHSLYHVKWGGYIESGFQILGAQTAIRDENSKMLVMKWNKNASYTLGPITPRSSTSPRTDTLSRGR